MDLCHKKKSNKIKLSLLTSTLRTKLSLLTRTN